MKMKCRVRDEEETAEEEVEVSPAAELITQSITDVCRDR